MRKIKAILLDRDGTLIEDKNYTYKVEDFEILPGVIEGLKILNEHFLFFIITNQSGIGRGYYTEKDFHRFNEHLINYLEGFNLKIEETYFCPHIKEMNCDCRKPKTKFIDLIQLRYNIDLKSSWMIGDHPSDIEFGINSGCRTVYLTSGHGDKHLQELKVKHIRPTLILDNFLKAATKIVQLI